MLKGLFSRIHSWFNHPPCDWKHWIGCPARRPGCASGCRATRWMRAVGAAVGAPAGGARGRSRRPWRGGRGRGGGGGAGALRSSGSRAEGAARTNRSTSKTPWVPFHAFGSAPPPWGAARGRHRRLVNLRHHPCGCYWRRPRGECGAPQWETGEVSEERVESANASRDSRRLRGGDWEDQAPAIRKENEREGNGYNII
jgi:hypothetical protein